MLWLGHSFSNGFLLVAGVGVRETGVPLGVCASNPLSTSCPSLGLDTVVLGACDAMMRLPKEGWTARRWTAGRVVETNRM